LGGGVDGAFVPFVWKLAVRSRVTHHCHHPA
jgi:hypothetical protein